MNDDQRRDITFVHCGKVVRLRDFPPDMTLLEWLRVGQRLTGTKEGCGEGDCGACTVALGRLRDDRIVLEPVNACILLLGQIDGRELITVEDLAIGGVLHPVQDAMVRHHASQCGFCTPGFVMSLFTLHHDETIEDKNRNAVLSRIAGNLCRCTGYRPIVEAGIEACARPATDQFAQDEKRRIALLESIQDENDVFVGHGEGFFAAPASLDSLCALAMEHPDATLVAGATDVGLWVTKQKRSLPNVIHTGRVAALKRIERIAGGIRIGAAVTYADAATALCALDPDMRVWLERLGSTHVRASGTIGGNIANGSPIGDSAPVLIALGATLHLRHGQHARSMPLEAFFLGYGRQDRARGEIVTFVDVPHLQPNMHFRAFKIARRIDQDISAVMVACRLTIEDRIVREARIAFGGMAGTPKRARLAEQAAVGIDLDRPASWQACLDALANDFTPLDDLRASRAYRDLVARNAVEKALIEIAGRDRSATRIAPLVELAHGH